MKTQAYYEELFEDLVGYSEWNPDSMYSESDLREQLQKTLNNKFSDNLFNRMIRTNKFEQKSLDNFNKVSQELSKEEGLVVPEEEINKFKGLHPFEIKQRVKQKYIAPMMERGFNIKGSVKGVPTLVRQETFKIRNSLVTRLRDSKGRFASRK